VLRTACAALLVLVLAGCTQAGGQVRGVLRFIDGGFAGDVEFG